MRRTTTIDLSIPDDAWEATGWGEHDEPRDRLLAQVYVMGIGHHLEAYRAVIEDGCLRLASDAMEEELMPKLQDIYDGCYQTVTIRGEQYVLLLFPHAD